MALGKYASVHRSADQGGTYGSYITSIIGELSLPEVTTDTQEVTEYGAAHNFKEFDATLNDAGSLSFAALYKPNQTDIDAMEVAQISGEEVYLQIQIKADLNKTISFKGIITKVGKPTPLGEHITRSLEIKVSGPLIPGTYTPPAE